MDRKYALIPAYEPDGRLLEIIEGAVAEGFQVIVVDDGSSDDCHKIRIQTCIRGEGSRYPDRSQGILMQTAPVDARS